MYMPCCWIGNHPKLGRLREFLGDDFQQLDAKRYSIEQMENSDAMRRIEDSWEEGTLAPCVAFCGNPFKKSENPWRDDELTVDLDKLDIPDEEQDPSP